MRDRCKGFTTYFMQDNEEMELDGEISSILEEMQELNEIILEKEALNGELKINYEWLSDRCPCEPDLTEVESAIASEQQRTQSLKREKAYIPIEHARSSLEADKVANPKLFTLKKKLLDLQISVQEKKDRQEELETLRTDLVKEYRHVIKMINGEERALNRIRGLEQEMNDKEGELNGNKEQQIYMNETVRQFESMYNVTDSTEELIKQQISINNEIDICIKQKIQIEAEVAEVERQIKNPIKNEESSYELMRKEVQKLEKDVMDRDQELKELEEERKKMQKLLKETQEKAKDLESKYKAKPKPAITFSQSFTQKKVASPGRSPASPYRSCYSPNRSPCSAMKSPYSPYKSMMSQSSRRKRKNEEEERKRKMMNDIEEHLVSENTKQLFETLKGFNVSGEGVASKLIAINRQQFGK